MALNNRSLASALADCNRLWEHRSDHYVRSGVQLWRLRLLWAAIGAALATAIKWLVGGG